MWEVTWRYDNRQHVAQLEGLMLLQTLINLMLNRDVDAIALTRKEE